jgi:excisionase family DNA binding protein
MHLSIKEAAHLLNVSENKVRGYILSGKLVVERKGRQILIPEAQLKALVDAEELLREETPQSSLDPVSRDSGENPLEVVLNRLTALEAQVTEKWRMDAENQRLHEVMREQDRQLAEKNLDMEKLQRDLVYQKRLGEKEIEDHRQALEEKLALIEKEASKRVARERELLEQKLALMEEEASKRAAHERELLEQRLIEERNIWSERLAQEQERTAREHELIEQKLTEERNICSGRLAQEQERFAQKLAAMQNQEGFWSRLLKMITWS